MDLRLKPCTTTITDTDIDVDIGMNKRSKPCTSFQDCSDSVLADRLTTLPVELVIRILSLLPTKDAAAACFLSKRIMKYAFPCITSLDLDDSPITHCSKHGSGIERFPTFVTFVDSILKNHQSQYLTRFRLRVGAEHLDPFKQGCSVYCGKECSPDLKPMQLNAWISFPLTRYGLRELDLRLRVREVGDDQLSPEIFTCETLEVLKLDTNLGFDQASTVQSFRLPNLKLFHLLGVFILEDDFLTNLVSSCPLLEDLNVKAKWNYVKFINITSPSLRRMCLYVAGDDLRHNADIVLIYTPNLEYLNYADNLAYQYSIANMDRLVEADISIENELQAQGCEVSFQQMLRFIRPLSNVQHLALNGMCTEVLKFADLEDHQLPVFPHLKCLELQYPGPMFWDNLLLPFLNCSPALETLVFPHGFTYRDYGLVINNDKEAYELEREFCRTALAIIPSCCRYHLKRIVIKNCFISPREIDLIEFLLRHALVLEELVLILSTFADKNYQMTFESTLQNLPRASVTCSIQSAEEYTHVIPATFFTFKSNGLRRHCIPIPG